MQLRDLNYEDLFEKEGYERWTRTNNKKVYFHSSPYDPIGLSLPSPK